MFSPLARAIAQLDDPAIFKILVASLALSAASFAALGTAAGWGLHHALAAHSWLAWLAGALGGFAVLASALWLFLPAAVLIASLFMEPVCRAVERRWYPGLAAPHGARLGAQLWDAALVALLVGAMSLLSLVLALVLPGLGLALGWAITAWALGRGLFVAVAMRRMDRQNLPLRTAVRPGWLVRPGTGCRRARASSSPSSVTRTAATCHTQNGTAV